ncbi:Uncharacterised protein [uncultured archaeon]|nr:Uncharacterised protein [uncultured archaeon]
MLKLRDKNGQILTENLIFIILNLVFLSILILFIYSKMSGPALMEEQYSKQIALLVDYSKTPMLIKLDMEEAFSKAKSNGVPIENVVTITNNVVNVNIAGRKGYDYSFFRDAKQINIDKYLEENKLVLRITTKE